MQDIGGCKRRSEIYSTWDILDGSSFIVFISAELNFVSSTEFCYFSSGTILCGPEENKMMQSIQSNIKKRLQAPGNLLYNSTWRNLIFNSPVPTFQENYHVACFKSWRSSKYSTEHKNARDSNICNCSPLFRLLMTNLWQSDDLFSTVILNTMNKSKDINRSCTFITAYVSVYTHNWYYS